MLLAVIKQAAIQSKSSIRETIVSMKKRVDDKLPLGLQIGRMIEFNSITPLMLEADFTFTSDDENEDFDYLSMKGVFPTDGVTVEAFSQTTTDGFIYNKLYLSDEAGYLEIITKDDVIIDDGIKFYSLVSEVIPESINEWNMWLPDPEQKDPFYWIGYPYFHLGPEQEIDDDGEWIIPAYERYWSHGDNIVKPERQDETIYLDIHGKNTIAAQHECMMYGRRSAKYIYGEEEPDYIPTEWCMVSVVKTDNGKSVNIFAGYTLSENDFEIY